MADCIYHRLLTNENQLRSVLEAYCLLLIRLPVSDSVGECTVVSALRVRKAPVGARTLIIVVYTDCIALDDLSLYTQINPICNRRSAVSRSLPIIPTDRSQRQH